MVYFRINRLINNLLLVLCISCCSHIGMVYASDFKSISLDFSSDSNKSHPISLRFNGKLYTDKQKNTFDQILSLGGGTKEEKFIMQVIQVYKGGDKDAMLKLWNPSERSQIKPMMDDPVAYDKNLALYNNILSSKFLAMLQYGGFVLCYVEHDLKGVGPYVKLYPIKIEDKNLYLSNILMHDFFFQKIAFQLGDYIKQEVEKK
ncbi:hypothetical protein PL263_02050 [Methylomonas sp. EFPC3]|uniref:hypothetical protein n=1 Tax=Methylomonas sp. EFPC3 TaxID=3021710 RepID=UPI0024163381|nr:hypothetical protein [Methylomonas sp. EFPC3]WFP50819.1 hypothetical protein PL263_02050 [Methylomonas sp. EFPC3]